MTTPRYALNDGTSIPAIGFGTYPLKGEEGIAAMTSALEVGYRLLDTAVNYENEREVGEALRRSGLPREEVQIASKVPGRDHANERAVRTASSEQVRRPINRDGVGQWQPYDAWLAPLRDALGPVLDAYPEAPASFA